MKTAEDIRKEYDGLDALCGIDTRFIEIRLSGRMTRKLGYFQVERKPKLKFGVIPVINSKAKIVISKMICDDEQLFTDVIRHEYAHAMVYILYGDGHGHDKYWRAACRKVGCNPRATYRGDSPVLQEKLAEKQRNYKYELVCSKCGSRSRYKSECTAVKIAEGLYPFRRLYCRHCGGGRFEVNKL